MQMYKSFSAFPRAVIKLPLFYLNLLNFSLAVVNDINIKRHM